MNAIAPTRPTVQHKRRISLPAGPTAAAAARSHVRAAVYAWDVPVDTAAAVLLTSELVTNAIRHETGETVTIAISCGWGQFRVDVHDSSRAMPVLMDGPADAETGRGLVLVSTMAANWGYYETPAGKAVYFTLAYGSDLDTGENRQGNNHRRVR